MDKIDDFVNELANFKNTTTVTNPYLDVNIANNLKTYLKAMCQRQDKRILLVGEAPGYKGCKVTGIPFTSGAVFERFSHSLLDEIKEDILLLNIESENTASIVWEYLSTKTNTPLFWNSFPFHPHPVKNENTNRPPIQNEIEMGVEFLKKLASIYKPQIIAGIGRNGVRCAKQAFPDKEILYIRHPSFGGKSEFVKGMDNVLG